MTDTKTKTITITITQNCNLSCTYCYEHHKSQQVMNLSTAKEIVDFELKNSNDFDELEFDLFGGEPFLEFDLIKAITEYICEKKGSKPCTVFATTNGTLVHGKIQEWLKEHSGCFVCGLSLDGTREMHNLNRSNSYDAIDIDFFLKQYPQQDVKMTISQKTLPSLADGVIELHKKGFLVSCNLGYEIDWSAPGNEDILRRELERLIDFYLKHPDVEPCSMLEMGIYNVGDFEEAAVRQCGAGLAMRAYDVDGRSYPCQFFMPLSVGEEKAQASQNIQFPGDIIPEECLDEKCRTCVIRSVCSGCFGASYASTGSIYGKDENMCRLTKIIIKARAYFKARQWERGQLKENEENTQALLRSIIRIQERLEV